MRRAGLLVAVALAAAGGEAGAQEPSPARRVVVAPLSALGAEDTSPAARRLQGELEQALAAIGQTLVLDSQAALAEIKKARRPDLRICDGDVKCLADLGRLVGADLVVAGQAGGLGDVQIVYLQLVDVRRARGVRATTLEVGDAAGGGPRGAATRLLAPDQYLGTMTLVVDAPGATIYVDGKRVARSGATPREPVAIPLAVGTHALRVTHPEYRDFVRFVDVAFQDDARIEVPLQQFPVIETEVAGRGRPATGVTHVDPPAPWYRTWWAVAAFSGVVLVAAAATTAVIADGVDADAVRPVRP
jgi:hypothetical protein